VQPGKVGEGLGELGRSEVFMQADTTVPGQGTPGFGEGLCGQREDALGVRQQFLARPGEADAGAVGRPRRRQWLGARMLAALTMAFGTTMLLSGVDLAIVATLKEAGQLSWAAVVIAVSGMTSVAGGLIYGALPRPLPTWLLLGLLGLVTILAGLARDWHWLCAAVLAVGILTAPTLSTVADAVSRLAPASVRGEATGLQSTAMSAGVALGSPIAGVAIGLASPAGGFAVAGLAGLAAALTGCLLSRRAPAATLSPQRSLRASRGVLLVLLHR
jgi:MFS family permease